MKELRSVKLMLEMNNIRMSSLEGLAQRAAGASLCVRAYEREKTRDGNSDNDRGRQSVCLCVSWAVSA